MNRKDKVMMGIYNSSISISLTAMTIVALLEVFMLVYSVVNPPLFREYIWTYRNFYVVLLTVAVLYISLSVHVKRDMAKRFRVFNIVNPLCAVFFFAWALGITYFDSREAAIVDPTVFMTFSLVVPIAFYVFPSVYALIVAIADAVMVYGITVVTGSAGMVLNFVFFVIFQLVLGITFLRLKGKLSEQVVIEQENANIDAMTGLLNRRAYSEELNRDAPMQSNQAFIDIDVNGLKKINDNRGHDAGDKLIIGAAQCLWKSLKSENKDDHCKIYRVGGDEYVVSICADREDLQNRIHNFDDEMRSWSERNGMELSASYGCVYSSEFPGKSKAELIAVADERMYEVKEEHYGKKGRDRGNRVPA